MKVGGVNVVSISIKNRSMARNEEDNAIVVREGGKAEIVCNGITTIMEGYNIKGTNIVDFKGFTDNIPKLKPPKK